MPVSPSPSATSERRWWRRAALRLVAGTALTALTAPLLLTAPTGASAPDVDPATWHRLSADQRSGSHDVTVTGDVLRLTHEAHLVRPATDERVWPAYAPALRLAVLRPDGTRVSTRLVASGEEVTVPVTEGDYQVRVSTPRRPRWFDVRYRLRATGATQPDPPVTPTPTPPGPPLPPGPPTPPGPAPVGIAGEVCGTWVLQQVTSAGDLERLRPRLEDALALPGVAGLSVRFPWDAADLTGPSTTHPLLDTAAAIAADAGKPLSIRFMAGAHTPARVFAAGASSYLVQGDRVPLPWDGASGTNDVFLREYAAYAGRLATWSRAHDVRLLHLSWYGLDWAELNHGAEVRAAEGYSYTAWLRGHQELIDVAGRLASDDLAVELPLSGYGPLSGGEAADLAEHIMVQPRSADRFFVQANGWDETQEWGSPSTAVEQQFDRIWAQPLVRGLQMIQPDGYDWPRVFDRLDAVGATYGEVYLPSFWQVPGPTTALASNTAARIADLEREIAGFHRRTCG